jgi:hypothetical protein
MNAPSPWMTAWPALLILVSPPGRTRPRPWSVQHDTSLTSLLESVGEYNRIREARAAVPSAARVCRVPGRLSPPTARVCRVPGRLCPPTARVGRMPGRLGPPAARVGLEPGGLCRPTARLGPEPGRLCRPVARVCPLTARVCRASGSLCLAPETRPELSSIAEDRPPAQAPTGGCPYGGDFDEAPGPGVSFRQHLLPGRF